MNLSSAPIKGVRDQMHSTGDTHGVVVLGLGANLEQFSLLVLLNAVVPQLMSKSTVCAIRAIKIFARYFLDVWTIARLLC